MGSVAAIASGVTQAGADVYGAYQNNQTNATNTANQQRNRDQLIQMILPRLQDQSGFTSQYANLLAQLQGTNGVADPRTANLEHPFTYDPTRVGPAPTINPTSMSTVGSRQIDPTSLTQITPAQARGNDFLTPQQITAPAAVSTQTANPGQDALMQLLRSNVQVPGNTQLTDNLNRLSSGNSQFDLTPSFQALNAQEQQDTDRQVAGLHASAGSLGQRFGTAMNQNEGQLRAQIETSYNLQRSQVSQQAFENAQNRALSATNTQSTYQTGLNQLPFQQAGLQLNAGQSLGGLFNQGQGLSLQAQSTNAANALQAALSNQSSGLTAGQYLMQLAQSNAGLQQQGNMSNSQNMLQMLLANQTTGLSSDQTNSQNMLQMLLANQNVSSQYDLSNANIMNQAGQYNSQAGMQQTQFNANQNQLYNQLIMSLLGGSQGADQMRQQNNTNLLSLIAGLPVPAQQYNQIPGAISSGANDITNSMLLSQFLGRSSTGQVPGVTQLPINTPVDPRYG